MPETGTFDRFPVVIRHHLDMGLAGPSGFDQSFRIMVPFLMFINFSPVDLAPLFHIVHFLVSLDFFGGFAGHLSFFVKCG